MAEIISVLGQAYLARAHWMENGSMIILIRTADALAK